MANFDEAYNITIDYEGGYSNDPDDAGGETYKGISRKYFPDWHGWETIDEAKGAANFPNNLRANPKLDKYTKKFFRKHFWNLFWGDKVPNQEIANELFDTGVNQGVHTAVKYLQTGLNVLNRNQKSYDDIVDDGVFGPNTLSALIQYNNTHDPALLYKVMNILQGMHYIEYMKKSPIQEKYARGWLKRVEIIKSNN